MKLGDCSLRRRARRVIPGTRPTFAVSPKSSDLEAWMPELPPAQLVRGRPPFELLLPRRVDTIFCRAFVEADDQLVSDACTLLRIELEDRFEDRFARGRQDETSLAAPQRRAHSCDGITGAARREQRRPGKPP